VRAQFDDGQFDDAPGGYIRGWRRDLSDPDTPNGFDALRFIAATCVLVGHSWPLTGRKPEPFPGGWDTLGGIGVGCVDLAPDGRFSRIEEATVALEP